MSGFRYLSQAHLRGFDTYKYKAVDTSPLTKYVVNPYWNAVVKVVPLWVAPNLLTFVGWTLVICNFCALSYYDWDYMTTTNDVGIVRPPIPAVLWVVCGVFQFISHTLDGIDGKQARRTGNSTPLGELFDHGLDSFSAILLPLSLMSAFGRGHQWGGTTYDAFFPSLAAVGGFYLTHWEKYITGVLYLPWILDIIQLGCVLGYIVTGIFGVQFWYFYMFPGWTVAFVLKWVLIGGFFGSIPMTLWNIYEHYNTPPPPSPSEKQQDSSQPLPRKLLGFTEAMRPVAPFLLMSILYTGWVYLSPTQITEIQPKIFFLTLGIMSSNISCRLIISQMSSQTCETFNYLLIPLALAFGGSLLLPIYEVYFLYVFAALVLIAHVHYGVFVVRELCDHFHIYCFSITSKPDATL